MTIVLNGTTGITTPDVSTTTETISGGTANGVQYLNGSKAVTTGTALVFDGTNLGIGTSSPSYKLDVYSASSAGVVLFRAGSGQNSFLSVIGNGNSFLTSSFDMIQDTLNQAQLVQRANAPMLFFTNNTEQMRITAAGNVGIGTSSPANKLEVSSANNIIYSTGTAGFGSFYARGSGTNNSYIFMGNATSGEQGRITVEDGGAITFANTASATERMRISSNGNVGIGATANASAILDAQSTTKGVRMPNMTTTQKNAITSPAAGLMVFDTTLAKLCVYSGSAWQTITSV